MYGDQGKLLRTKEATRINEPAKINQNPWIQFETSLPVSPSPCGWPTGLHCMSPSPLFISAKQVPWSKAMLCGISWGEEDADSGLGRTIAGRNGKSIYSMSIPVRTFTALSMNASSQCTHSSRELCHIKSSLLISILAGWALSSGWSQTNLGRQRPCCSGIISNLVTNYCFHDELWPGFSSVTQLCLTLCCPMDCSTPGLPVHHQLPELTQTHVLWVGDAIQPSHPLSSPSPPAFNLSQHQGLFQWVSSSYQVDKVLEFQLQHQSFQWIFRTDFL